MYSADAEAGLARRSKRKSRRGGEKGKGKETYDELGADLATALRAHDTLGGAFVGDNNLRWRGQIKPLAEKNLHVHVRQR